MKHTFYFYRPKSGAHLIVFTGQYTHNLDSKWRLTIPAAFRNELRGGLALTPGPDGCVYVYTLEAWEEIAAKLEALPDTQKNRSVRRYMLSKTYVEYSLEKAGRVLLPEGLRNHANIEKTVSIVGDGRRLVIWAAERWQPIAEDDTENFNTNYEALALQGLM